ncbi:hypothetical protein VARIO8X_50008 [Burkholderiales bacterium 8X]|nr:hypothetical protein VARIO8X_50008 [Burkholderiales bacterium 8X]
MSPTSYTVTSSTPASSFPAPSVPCRRPSECASKDFFHALARSSRAHSRGGLASPRDPLEGALGRRASHGRRAIRSRQEQRAAPGGLRRDPRRPEDGARRPAAPGDLFFGGASQADLAALVQPLRRFVQQLRQPCRQRRAVPAQRRRPGSHRRFMHLVPERSGELRRRRPGDRGHLRAAAGQAAGRRPGALSGHQRSPGAAGNARHPRRELLLDPEHDSKRRAAPAAVRHGQPSAPPAKPLRRNRSGRRRADQYLSQPAADVARRLSPAAAIHPEKSTCARPLSFATP